MNIYLMIGLIAKANEDDYIKIEYGNKEITFKKRFMGYTHHNDSDTAYLEITDSSRKETYLFKTNSIDVVTLIKPKFKGMTWYNQGQTKLKAGAEQ